MQQNAIAIFVKTPGLSPIKTRLAETIGEKKALKFYALCLEAVKEIVQEIDAKIYWAVGEQQSLGDDIWQGFDRLWTGEGGLGERQAHIYGVLKDFHHNVMLLGVDCPQITPEALQDGFSQLQQFNYALGPARDGGYYLLAGRQSIPSSIWTNVPYSAANTRSEIYKQLDSATQDLPQLTDVDELEDLEFMLQEMPERPTPAQQKVIDWAKAVLVTHAA